MEFEKLNRIGEGTYGIVCKYICIAVSLFKLFCLLDYFDIQYYTSILISLTLFF